MRSDLAKPSQDKLAGILIGLATGDALGAPHEFKTQARFVYRGYLYLAPEYCFRCGKRVDVIGQTTENRKSNFLQHLNRKMQQPEIWFEIQPVYGLSKYLISTFGRLWSKWRKRLITGSINASGYQKVHITFDDGTERFITMHRLMAIIFLPNPENKPSVDHIDRNRSNNNLNNLKWATNIEQSNNVKRLSKITTNRKIHQFSLDGTSIKIWNSVAEAAFTYGSNGNTGTSITRACKGHRGHNMAYGFIWRYLPIENLKDEIWQEIPGLEGYFASDKGRIKRVKATDEKLLDGCINGGYYDVSIKHKTYRLHRLIALTFISEKPGNDYEINHKDGNKLNNQKDNLEWLTHGDNVRHAHANIIDTSKISKAQQKAVKQYSLDNIFIKEYPSTKEASLTLGISAQSISRVCNGKNITSGGFKWAFA